MRATTRPTNIGDARAVDLKGLQTILSCGRKTAETIAHDAGARVQIGKRVLYNVHKVQEYLDEIAK